MTAERRWLGLCGPFANGVLLLAGGCIGCQRQSTADAPALAAESTTVSATGSQLNSAPVAAGDPGVRGTSLRAVLSSVGIARVLQEPAPKAHAHNAAGLALLRKGSAAEALAVFDQALLLAPDWLPFRYNHVCALVLSGQHETAAREFADLSWLDPVYSAERWQSDPDLTSLRTSSWAQRLTAELSQAQAEVRRVLPGAVSAQITGLRSRSSSDGIESNERWVQPGIYVHETRRFVSLAPRLTSPQSAPYHPPLAAALTDVTSGSVLVLLGSGNNGDIPSIPKLEFTLFAAGGATARWSFQEQGAEVQLYEVRFEQGKVEGRRFQSQPHGFGAWFELGARGFAKRSDAGDAGGARLHVSQGGVCLMHGAPPGFDVKSERLRTPNGTILLPARTSKDTQRPSQTFIAQSPDRRVVAVVEWWGDLSASGMSDEPDRSRVVTIDLSLRRVNTLREGPGWASVAFDASNALYLSAEGVVRRFADPLTATSEPTLAGISL